MMAFVAICNDVGPPAEPFLLPLLPTLMGHFADKVLLLASVALSDEPVLLTPLILSNQPALLASLALSNQPTSCQGDSPSLSACVLRAAYEEYQQSDMFPSPEPHLLQAPPVRKRADQAGEAFIEMLNPWTTPLVLLVLYEGFANKRNWQVLIWLCILLRLPRIIANLTCTRAVIKCMGVQTLIAIMLELNPLLVKILSMVVCRTEFFRVRMYTPVLAKKTGTGRRGNDEARDRQNGSKELVKTDGSK
jgi:hypothetical protein